jgi:hypothetical protein
MEPTRSARLEPGQPIHLILLGCSEQRIDAGIQEVRGPQVTLQVRTALRHGQPVRLETGDNAFLGEIIWCHGGPETYVASVQIDQVLAGLEALGRMLTEFEADVRTEYCEHRGRRTVPAP